MTRVRTPEAFDSPEAKRPVVARSRWTLHPFGSGRGPKGEGVLTKIATGTAGGAPVTKRPKPAFPRMGRPTAERTGAIPKEFGQPVLTGTAEAAPEDWTTVILWSRATLDRVSVVPSSQCTITWSTRSPSRGRSGPGGGSG